MKRIAFFGFVFALLIGALLFANRRRQQTPAYLLRGYPQSDNLKFIIEDNSQPPNREQALFYTTWFNSNSTDPSMGCTVARLGSKTCGRSSVTATGPFTNQSIGTAQVAAFDKIAPILPPSASHPTLNNLLIVSYRDGKTWTTRVYDRSDLPDSVVKIHRILGITGFDKKPS